MTERFVTGPLLRFMPTGDAGDRNWQEAGRYLVSELVEVADTGAADTALVVAHGLGRVPRGVRLVNQGTSGVTNWYRDVGDVDWTYREIVVRFDVANAHVLLELI